MAGQAGGEVNYGRPDMPLVRGQRQCLFPFGGRQGGRRAGQEFARWVESYVVLATGTCLEHYFIGTRD